MFTIPLGPLSAITLTAREILIGLVVVAVLAIGVSLYAKGRAAGVAAEKPKTEMATDNAVARGLEVKGADQVLHKVEAHAARTSAAAAATADLIKEAASAPDAQELLDPARADRLRRHDDRLCDIAPELVGCPAAGDAAGQRAPALPPRSVAGFSDQG